MRPKAWIFDHDSRLYGCAALACELLLLTALGYNLLAIDKTVDNDNLFRLLAVVLYRYSDVYIGRLLANLVVRYKDATSITLAASANSLVVAVVR